jgi:hypothetical protein
LLSYFEVTKGASMTQQDVEILQLAQRIQLLSAEVALTSLRETEEMTFRLKKIRDLANALVPRIEESCASR